MKYKNVSCHLANFAKYGHLLAWPILRLVFVEVQSADIPYPL